MSGVITPSFKQSSTTYCGATAEIAKRLLVQPRPHLAARLPHHFAKRAPRVTQRHDEQTRFAVPATGRIACRSALAVVDLRLFGHGELEPIELLGFAFAQRPTEALHTVVAMRKAELVDQLLIDGYRVAPQAHLRFDPFPVRLTGRARVRRQASAEVPTALPRPPGPVARVGEFASLARRSRWPGWGNLPPHPAPIPSRAAAHESSCDRLRSGARSPAAPSHWPAAWLPSSSNAASRHSPPFPLVA